MLRLLTAMRDEKAGLPVLGLAFTHAWILAPFLSGGMYYACFHMSFAAALFATAFVYHLFPQGSRLAGAMPWVAAACMCVSTLGAVLVGGSSGAVQVTTGVVGGASSAYLFSRWFVGYSTLTIKCAVASTLFAFALSGFVRLLLVMLKGASAEALAVLLAFLPFASALCLSSAAEPGTQTVYTSPAALRLAAVGAMGTGGPAGNGGPAGTGGAPRKDGPSGKGGAAGGPAFVQALGGSIPAVTLEVLAYGLVFGMMRNGINEWSVSAPSMLLGHALRILLPLLMAWWMVAHASSRDGGQALRMATLLAAFAILALVFFGGLEDAALSAVVLAERSLVSILIYVRAFEVMQRAKLHPCVAYCFGRGVYEVGLVLGLLLFDAMDGAGLLAMVSSDVYYFFACCVLLLLLSGFSGALRIPFLAGVPKPAASAFDQACERLAGECGLTERELEVMKLTCRGNTKKKAAELLGLSEDTIRYHTKNIYQKLDVHSRQELLDMLGIE